MRIPIESIVSVANNLVKINISYLQAGILRMSARKYRETAGLKTWPTANEVLDQNCVFVLSTGRCGTELLTKILGFSERLYVEHNPKPELEYASSRIYQDDISGNDLKIAFLAARFDVFLLESWLRNKIYVETNNRITFFAPAIAALMPNSKFIHLVRNPAEFVVSGMRRGYYDEQVIQHQRLTKFGAEDWDRLTRIEKVALEWNEINARIEDFKATTSKQRILTVKSEDLFTNPEVTKSIFHFVDVDDPFMVSDKHDRLNKILAKPVNKQTTGYFPRYKDWSESDKLAFRRITTLAAQYGYTY